MRFLLTSFALLTFVAQAQEVAPRGNAAWLASNERANAQGEPFVALVERIGGHWTAQWSAATRTPKRVIGTGLRLAGWIEDSEAEASRHARLFFDAHGDLFGSHGHELREESCLRMGQTWAIVYSQSHRGLPVIGARADVRIHGSGVLSMAGAVIARIPESFDIAPAIDDGSAFAIAFAQRKKPISRSHQLAIPQAPRLVIWMDCDAPSTVEPKLCWEVAIRNVDCNGHGDIGRSYVDAKQGVVLRYENDKHACGDAGCNRLPASSAGADERTFLPTPTTVTVMAWTQTGASAASAPVNVPMPRFVVTVPGIGPVTTDANGRFAIDIAAPVTITVANLDGVHHAPILPALAAPASVVVTPGVPATLQLFSATSPDSQLAHANAAHWIDRANEWARGIFGDTPQLAVLDSILPSVNVTVACNAFYAANTISFYSADPIGACRNSSFSTVVAHEWGHGLDDRHGGIANAFGDGLSEGWGDTVAMYLLDTPDVALDFFTVPGSVLRSGNNAVRYGTQNEPHLAGQSWMGFAWHFRQNLRTSRGTAEAIRVSNAVLLGSIVGNARNQVDAVTEAFLADDDDGNLFNGVPHYIELSTAAQQKGLPWPQTQVAVLSHSPLAESTNPHGARGVRATSFPVATGAIQQVTLVYSRNGEPEVTQQLARGGSADEWLGLIPGVARGAVRYRIESLHSSGAVVRSPVHGDHVYTVVESGLAPFAVFEREDFEAGGVGWSFGVATLGSPNDWQVDRPQGFGGVAFGSPWTDAPGAFSGRLALGTNLRGNGATTGQYPSNCDSFARSPIYDCTGKSGVFLRFRRWLCVQSGEFDDATIRVNGALVWANPPNQPLIDMSWQLVEIPLPMADNQSSVQIEFGLKSDGSVELGGWTIDDVELGERAQIAAAPVLRVTPERMPPLTPVTLTVQSAPFMPFVFVIADQDGPGVVPGLPPVMLSGTQLVQLFAFCDASGSFTYSFPTARAPYGFLFHSQALTLDSNLQLALTNGCTNLILP